MLPRVKVSCGLGLLIKFSRILGISLVSITPATDGYFVKFSHATAIYSYCCVTLCNIFTVIALLVDLKQNGKFPFAKLLDATIVITYCTFMSCTGVSRTKSMLEHLICFNKIRMEVCCLNQKSQSLEKTHQVFYLTFLLLWIIIYILYFINSLFMAKNIGDYMYLIVIFHSLQICVLETIMLMLKLKVYSALRMLSGELRTQLDIMKPDHIEMVARSSTKNNIRNVTNAFISICKVVDQINEKYGVNMLFTIFTIIFYIIFAIGDIVATFKNDKNIFSIVYVLVWLFILLSRLYTTVDPCYFISKEAKNIRVLLSKLMCNITAVGKSYSWEWDLIFKQLYMAEPIFTPLGLFTLNRCFFISIISIVTTYVMIAMPHIHTISAFFKFQ